MNNAADFATFEIVRTLRLAYCLVLFAGAEAVYWTGSVLTSNAHEAGGFTREACEDAALDFMAQKRAVGGFDFAEDAARGGATHVAIWDRCEIRAVMVDQYGNQ